MSPTEEPTAVLFDIQRLALDDGPGIRTNLFFKGCPLRCAWCHNPESYLMQTQLGYSPARCVACGLCVEACPEGVHGFEATEDGSTHRVAHEKCTACGECIAVCCYDALTLSGRRYSIEELLAAVAVDRPYYAIGSGGGVTLTGGEPMLQWRFIEAFLNRLEGVHTALETSGHAPRQAFEALLPSLDLILFDYKATDPQIHRRLCGVDNDQILDNLEFICEGTVPVVLRLPLVPGVNDDDDHLQGVVKLLEAYPGIEYAQVMPYHNLGKSKREQFGMEPQRLEVHDATAQESARWREKLVAFGAARERVL